MPWFRSLALLLAASLMATAADWPQWLGPQRDGSSPEKVAAWKDAPKVLWRQPVGEGHSSPIVANGKVYLHVKVKDKEQEEAWAFDAKEGKPLWNTPYDRAKFGSIFGAGPRATPAVAGGKLFTFGVTGVLTAFDADKGTQLWQLDTLKDFKAPNLFFGASSSPLVEGDNVLVNVGGKGASVVAFTTDKGKVAWQALNDGATYSSPIAVGKGKERQIIFLTKEGLVGLKAEDGAVFWRFPLVDKLSESSTTPVVIGDVLLGSSVTYGSVGLKMGSKDDKPTVAESWKEPALTCYFSTPVAVKDDIYMVTGEIGVNGTATLRCVDAKTGKERWSRPKVGKYHAALLRLADDKLLLLEDSGQLALFEPDPKAYKELARSKVCGNTWAHPALSDGKLYLRDHKELICLQVGP